MTPIKPNTLRTLFLLYSLLVLSFAFISLSASKTTLNNTFVLSLRLDYLIHFSLFMLWMAIAHFAYQINFKKNLRNAIVWIFVGLLYCWFTEAVQLFIPYRSFNINDLLANSIGVLIGSVFFMIPLKKHKSMLNAEMPSR